MYNTEDIKINDLTFTPYLLREEILHRIQELAIRIQDEYSDKNPVFISVLNGSFMFTSDLIKQVDIRSEINFIKVSSYEGTESSGRLHWDLELTNKISNRHVVIIEDIVDTGLTMKAILNKIEDFDPASVEVCSLFLKKTSLKEDIFVKYVGFEIPNKFIVGYGLDYDGYGRNYQDVYQVTD